MRAKIIGYGLAIIIAFGLLSALVDSAYHDELRVLSFKSNKSVDEIKNETVFQVLKAMYYVFSFLGIIGTLVLIVGLIQSPGEKVVRVIVEGKVEMSDEKSMKDINLYTNLKLKMNDISKSELMKKRR